MFLFCVYSHIIYAITIWRFRMWSNNYKNDKNQFFYRYVSSFRIQTNSWANCRYYQTSHFPCSLNKALFFVTRLVENERMFTIYLYPPVGTEHFLYRTFLVWLRRSTLRGKASSPSMTSATACRLSCMVGLLSNIIYHITPRGQMCPHRLKSS